MKRFLFLNTLFLATSLVHAIPIAELSSFHSDWTGSQRAGSIVDERISPDDDQENTTASEQRGVLSEVVEQPSENTTASMTFDQAKKTLALFANNFSQENSAKEQIIKFDPI